MHSSMLAYEAPLICALTSFAAALLFFFSWRIGVRPWWVLVAVFGWLAWTIYFSLLTISAGPAPMLRRGEITAMIRWAELIGGVLIAIWLIFWTRHGIKYPWHISDDKASYLRENEC